MAPARTFKNKYQCGVIVGYSIGLGKGVVKIIIAKYDPSGKATESDEFLYRLTNLWNSLFLSLITLMVSLFIIRYMHKWLNNQDLFWISEEENLVELFNQTDDRRFSSRHSPTSKSSMKSNSFTSRNSDSSFKKPQQLRLSG